MQPAADAPAECGVFCPLCSEGHSGQNTAPLCQVCLSINPMLLSLTSTGCSEGHATCCCETMLWPKHCKEGLHVVGKSWQLETYSTVPSQLSLSSSPRPPPRFCNLGLEPLECCCLHSGLSSHFSCPHLDNHSQTSQRRVSLGDSRSFKLAIGINCYRFLCTIYCYIIVIIIGTRSHWVTHFLNFWARQPPNELWLEAHTNIPHSPKG